MMASFTDISFRRSAAPATIFFASPLFFPRALSPVLANLLGDTCILFRILAVPTLVVLRVVSSPPPFTFTLVRLSRLANH